MQKGFQKKVQDLQCFCFVGCSCCAYSLSILIDPWTTRVTQASESLKAPQRSTSLIGKRVERQMIYIWLLCLRLTNLVSVHMFTNNKVVGWCSIFIFLLRFFILHSPFLSFKLKLKEITKHLN